MRVKVHSQVELEEALRDHAAHPDTTIVLDAPDEVLRLAVDVNARIEAHTGRVEVAGDARLTATGSAVVNARAESVVFAHGQSQVFACGDASVALYQQAKAHVTGSAAAATFSPHVEVVEDADAARRLVTEMPHDGWEVVAGPLTDATYLAYPTGQSWNGERQFALDRAEMSRFIASGDGQDSNGEGLDVDAEGKFVDVANGAVQRLEEITVNGRQLFAPSGWMWDAQLEGDLSPASRTIPGTPTIGGIEGSFNAPTQYGPGL